MSPAAGPTAPWVLLCTLLCALVLVKGSGLSPKDSKKIAGTSQPGDSTPGTGIQLQPDLQTEAQAPTEAPTDLQTETLTEVQTGAQMENKTDKPVQKTTSNYTGLSCTPILPPRRGSFYVESGTGVSIGSLLTFWCREGYQLVGSDKIQCTVKKGKALWSNYLPVCEAIPRPEDRGLRVAVLASVVSGIVILAMSLSFLICCLQERSGRERAKKEGRSRRRDKRTTRRSECWLEREEGEWESFPPPKIFHLSQRMNPRLAPDSPLYLTAGLSGYENRGYQRSQESLLKASMPPGLYRSESQLYPHVVLQRVPTPTAPSAPSAPSAPFYMHVPPSASASSTPAHTTAHNQPHMMGQYPTPTYPPNPNTSVPVYPHPTPAPIYPNPNPTPQRPWQ
ncbi:sushi domain-containing protein 3 [Xyrichtys novacula]|uniref:Sushi domain-containing protein 3 n=1 Tax=Xyrichtys novacula TaxID=13765 RepID=A0AAV1EZX9_XYRNO|nr:sushi domain-containing protein 3 [Xyrichtys novacula]